jgi:rhodanese-related sulfurtransferase
MRLRRLVCAGLLAAAFALVAPAQQSDTPKEITTQELEKYLEDKKVFFLDVREPDEVKKLGSVPGYVNIPLGQLAGRLKEVPKDKLVITL